MIDFDTVASDKDVQQLINAIDHTRRQHDAKMLVQLISEITAAEAVIWGEDIIGFGRYRYLYKTGRKGYWPIISFTVSTEKISINIMPGTENYASLIKKIGRVKFSNTALTLHKLSDIHTPALKSLLQQVFEDMQNKHNCQLN